MALTIQGRLKELEKKTDSIEKDIARLKELLNAEEGDEELREAALEDMELGNLLFGHSRGNYKVPREWAYPFHSVLEELGFDSYGYPVKPDLQKYVITKSTEDETIEIFDNGVFSITPYYWGEEEKFFGIPNFRYHADDVNIFWYKYPMRDAYCNHKITDAKFAEILLSCKSSIEG